MTSSSPVEVQTIVELGLGRVPERSDSQLPLMSFDDRLGGHFDGAVARPLTADERRGAADQTLRALEWCSGRFPLSLRAGTDPRPGSIHEIGLGRSVQPRRLVSSSSPDLPGVVFLAAPWPLPFHHRVASVLAHENVHQALYVREAENYPVRDGSLGYSPWKDTCRPGRWVWHAYWTFACQVALLLTALSDDPSLRDVDEHLVTFVADMDAKVTVCLYSLSLFEIVTPAELARCNRARSVLDEMAARLDGIPGIEREREDALDRSRSRLASWASTLVAT